MMPALDDRPAILRAFRDFLRGVERLPRADRSWHGECHRWLQLVHAAVLRGELERSQVEALRRELGPAFNGPSTCQGWAAGRVRAGVGETELIDRIHTQWTATDPGLAKWDDFFHAQPAIRAIRGRTEFFGAWVREQELRAGAGGVSLVNLGSGPAHEIAAYYRGHPASRLRVGLVDQDPRALERAKALCAEAGDRVRYTCENAVRYTPGPGVTLVWAGGLLNTLSDRLLVVVLGRLWSGLPVGGELLLGNFSPSNLSRAYLELMVDWVLFHRRAEDLQELARQAGIPGSAVRVRGDVGEVQLFLHAVKEGPG